MASVTSNVTLLMYLKPLVTWAGWGPGALYISHPLLWDRGWHFSKHTHTYNPVNRLRAPRRRVVTSSEKGLNS